MQIEQGFRDLKSLFGFGALRLTQLTKARLRNLFLFVVISEGVLMGSTAVKCGRRQMPRITVEIEGTSKNVKLLLYAQNPVLTWDFSDTPHNAV